jgi:multiple sugar transport system ATP-binding protein
MASVRVEHLTKRFGQKVAVADANLKVADKEFTVLLGPSGCGKTTVLRCIAGLETLDNGTIYIDDVAVNKIPPRDRNVAMVFQDYALYPHMTAYANIEYPLKNRGVAKPERKNRVQEVAELLRITGVLDKRPAQMSGGERQRVALARAIVRSPKVFLMDEPLSNIDAQLRTHMRTELKRLHRELQVTTIFVTHDQVEAMTMADRILVMNDGAVLQAGSPDEVYNSPSDMFVGGFVGNPAMNFIPCRAVEVHDLPHLEIEKVNYPISPQLFRTIKDYADKEITLGVRPEDVSMSRVESKLVGEIYVVEPLGQYTIVDIALGNLTLKAITGPAFDEGRTGKVPISFDENRMHFFDSTTQKMIK